MELTERQKREKEYYEQYAGKFNLDSEIDFAPVLGPLSGREHRPWNSYWRSYEIPILEFKEELQTKERPVRLLDFGCGPGENALRFAKAGFHVTGFDISEANVKLSEKLFKKHQLEEQGNFLVSTAEELPFETDYFDAVVGIDILHHVDIERAIKEIKRVLRPKGIANFREPIEVPALDDIRNSKLVKLIIPNEASLEAHITEDERKLNERDVKIIRSEFPSFELEEFLIFSRLDRFMRRPGARHASWLEKLDVALMRYLPWSRSLAGGVIFKLRK